MPRCARAESETAAAPDGSGPQKNVDLLVAYLESSVEIAHDLGCSEHVLTMYDDVVSSVLSKCRKLKSPYPPLNSVVVEALAGAKGWHSVCMLLARREGGSRALGRWTNA